MVRDFPSRYDFLLYIYIFDAVVYPMLLLFFLFLYMDGIQTWNESCTAQPKAERRRHQKVVS